MKSNLLFFTVLILLFCTNKKAVAQQANIKLNTLSELDVNATAVQFKNVATGQYVVLKTDPRGGGYLEASATAESTPWYFYQGAGATIGNVEIKRKPVDGFNWSNYDNADDNKAGIAWNHAKRIPNATTPNAPHAWTIEEVSAGIFRIKWNESNQYLELMPNLKLTFLGPTNNPKVITRALSASNKHQQWSIEVNSTIVHCEGKQFKVDADKKIWEKRAGNWTHVGDRCNELRCERRRVFCTSTDGSVWRYNDAPHNWTPANTLLAGQFLNGGDGTMGAAMHLRSGNGKHFFYMQENGNLGIWSHNPTPTEIWNSRTNNGANCTLHMQTDGNLVAYDSNNNPIWASQTQQTWDPKYTDKKYMPVKAVLEDDGKLVLYSATGFRVWDTVQGKYPLN